MKKFKIILFFILIIFSYCNKKVDNYIQGHWAFMVDSEYTEVVINDSIIKFITFNPPIPGEKTYYLNKDSLFFIDRQMKIIILDTNSFNLIDENYNLTLYRITTTESDIKKISYDGAFFFRGISFMVDMGYMTFEESVNYIKNFEKDEKIEDEIIFRNKEK